jgi:pimeloyl-ACP methyl ester carboxylesterase
MIVYLDAMIEPMLDTLLHRWLHVPYTLHVRYVRRPKNPRATVLFIHGIGNSGDAWNSVIQKLPQDIQIVSIDLLGFGDSPKPAWATYNAKTQARSVLATFVKLRITTPMIIVGHSLGSLVAIEVSKRYPLLVKSLILCSPPLYQVAAEPTKKISLRADDVLKQLYTAAYERPDDFLKLSAIAMKYNLINTSFNVTSDNVASYMATLKAMIINQTSLADAYKLKTPTVILRGTLDPVVVTRNLKQLAKENPNVSIVNVLASHEVRGRFVGAVVKSLNAELKKSDKSAIT